LYYTLKREDLFNYIDLLSRRTSGQTGVNLENLREYEISIPAEISDQQEIARALSDTDNLINNTEKLIEKKKALKQGVMQELLTGKRRLPGFSGEWENMTIGQHGYLQKGSINPQTQPDDYFTEYSMPAFDDGRVPAQTLGKDMHSNRTVIHGKTLLFNKLNVRQQRIWLIEQCESNAVCSAEFLPYCSTEIDLKLLSQILYTDKVTEDFIGMSTGTSNSQKRITPKAFLDYTIYLPKDMEEQKALSKVFDDMDKEIEALGIQLEKYKKLKIGMMSKLLTGEIRLAE
jgi:type I restriction enzyme S subunit